MGAAIVGFGSAHYRYPSGRHGDTPAVAFSPRKTQSVLYLTGGLGEYEGLLARLGPHRAGKGRLCLKQVDRIDSITLRELVERSYHAAAAS